MSYKIVKSKREGRYGIQCDLNLEFNKQLKRLAGNLLFTDNTWWFDAISIQNVTKLADEFYDPSNYVEHDVAWNLENEYEAPSVDNMRLVWVQRDNYNMSQIPYQYSITDESLVTGGSIKNPKLSGTLAVKVLARKNAIFSPKPSHHQINDPATSFSRQNLYLEIRQMMGKEISNTEIEETALRVLKHALTNNPEYLKEVLN